MIDSVKVELIWERGAEKKLSKDTPDKIMHDIAEITLNLTYPTIPMLTGEMRRTTMAKGVQGADMHYKIGSYTDYAAYVYTMPDKTNWTTPGTNAYWFRECFQKNNKNILQEACERNKLK